MKLPPPFVELLTVALKRRGVSAAALAERLGLSQATMWRVTQGTRAPDLNLLDAWAKELDLSDADRANFILAGQLAHCPKEVVDLLGQLIADIEALQRHERELEATLERIMQRLAPAAPPAPAPRSTKR